MVLWLIQAYQIHTFVNHDSTRQRRMGSLLLVSDGGRMPLSIAAGLLPPFRVISYLIGQNDHGWPITDDLPPGDISLPHVPAFSQYHMLNRN